MSSMCLSGKGIGKALMSKVAQVGRRANESLLKVVTKTEVETNKALYIVSRVILKHY